MCVYRMMKVATSWQYEYQKERWMNGRPPNLKLCCRYVVWGYIRVHRHMDASFLLIWDPLRLDVRCIEKNEYKMKIKVTIVEWTYIQTTYQFLCCQEIWAYVSSFIKVYEINMLQLLCQRLNFQWIVGFDMVLLLHLKVNKREWPSSKIFKKYILICCYYPFSSLSCIRGRNK